MKNISTFVISVCALMAIGLACNMSTANMSSLKTSKDKDGKQETSSFKAGDTIYANAVISNSGSKTTVKFALVADDDSTVKKGETVPGSEVKVDLPSSGTASYSLPIPGSVKSGKYTLTAEMLNDAGEKKDSKSVDVSIEGSSAPPTAPAAETDSKQSDDDSDK